MGEDLLLCPQDVLPLLILCQEVPHPKAGSQHGSSGTPGYLLHRNPLGTWQLFQVHHSSSTHRLQNNKG